MSELYIGLMSGTSLDGIDVTLCEIDASQCKLIASLEYPFDKELKEEILQVINGTTSLEQIGTLDSKLGQLFADAINRFIQKEKIDTTKVTAIGLHGQTLWHKPKGDNPFSMQLGCPNVVSAKTGMRVVADFRRMDMANGGQGAPFAPAFHKEIFASLEKNIAVLNIGGMANLTVLNGELRGLSSLVEGVSSLVEGVSSLVEGVSSLVEGVSSLVEGWDTGCGNVLMDLWISQCKNIPYDKDGEVARSGEVDSELLNSMLQDEYFKQLPPKSTGREYFNETWLANYLPLFQTIKDEDIQRTLLELTAQTIANDVKKAKVNLLIVCGGGVKNTFLMECLEELCGIEVATSDEYGVSSEFMESMAFAWLAYKRVHREKVELSSVTGASKNSILGGIYG